jgi:hypothetical protein
MNAVDRFWRAVRRNDWEAAEAQLLDRVVVRHPHDGARYDRARDYVDLHRFDTDRRSVDVRESISEGKRVAVLAVITHGDGTTRHVAGFYELHDGKIAHADELWTETAGEPSPAQDD